jgi:U2 small nuclear ribonucleoprotein B''
MAATAQQTIHFRGLDDGVRKAEMKRTLYNLCAEYGVVVDVVVMKTPEARGQAWVVYRDVNSAVAALQALNTHYVVYGKPLQAQYAKKASFAVDPQQRAARDKARATA